MRVAMQERIQRVGARLTGERDSLAQHVQELKQELAIQEDSARVNTNVLHTKIDSMVALLAQNLGVSVNVARSGSVSVGESTPQKVQTGSTQPKMGVTITTTPELTQQRPNTLMSSSPVRAFEQMVAMVSDLKAELAASQASEAAQWMESQQQLQELEGLREPESEERSNSETQIGPGRPLSNLKAQLELAQEKLVESQRKTDEMEKKLAMAQDETKAAKSTLRDVLRDVFVEGKMPDQLQIESGTNTGSHEDGGFGETLKQPAEHLNQEYSADFPTHRAGEEAVQLGSTMDSHGLSSFWHRDAHAGMYDNSMGGSRDHDAETADSSYDQEEVDWLRRQLALKERKLVTQNVRESVSTAST